MGLHDRDYVRRRPPPGPLGGVMAGPRRWSVNTWIIVVNIAVFAMANLLSSHGIPVWLGDRLQIPQGVSGGILSTIDTYPTGNGATTGYLAEAGLDGRVVGYAPAPAAVVSRAGVTLARQLIIETPDGKRVPAGFRIYRVEDPLTALGHFSTARAFLWKPNAYQLRLELQVWRLVTFQFLHDGIIHIFFNMFGLIVFGRAVEEHLGGKRYAAFYLMCGLCGGLLYLALNGIGQLGIRMPGALFYEPTTKLVGASAGVFGIIIASAFISPNALMQLLFPPVTLKMKWLAYGYVAIAAFNLFIAQGANQGGDAAHLGGAIAGWFFIRRPDLLRDFFDVLGNSSKPARNRKRPGRAAAGPSTEELDRILAKIAREGGMSNLTKEEKRRLAESSEARRG